MIRVAVVEDEDVFAAELNAYLERYEKEKGRRFLTQRFRDGEEIARDYAGGFDLILDRKSVV